jgi:hypothetical protein
MAYVLELWDPDRADRWGELDPGAIWSYRYDAEDNLAARQIAQDVLGLRAFKLGGRSRAAPLRCEVRLSTSVQPSQPFYVEPWATFEITK